MNKTIVFAKEINARIVTTHAGVIGGFYNNKYLQSHISPQYQKLINAKNTSPIITIENLPKKLGFVRNYPSLAEIDNDEMWQNCNLTLDIGHAILDKIDYLKFLKTHISRIKNIHLHNIVNGKEHESIAKKGGLKLNELIATLNKLDYHGFVNLEIPKRQDLIDSWNYLQK